MLSIISGEKAWSRSPGVCRDQERAWVVLDTERDRFEGHPVIITSRSFFIAVENAYNSGSAWGALFKPAVAPS
jgi:hypothetical protein